MTPTPQLIDAVAKSCGNAEVVEKLLAGALAACALEARKGAFEEAATLVDGLQTSAVRNRMARLIRERAAEDKA